MAARETLDDEHAETLLSTHPPVRAEAHREGQVVAGRYRLDRRLAVGGMGEVWAANNLLLDQPVAMKLLGRAARSATGAERLLREARIAAKLRHPAIIRVFDLGMTETQEPFLVMELLEGRDAAELVHEAGPLDGVQAAQLMLPVVSGLATAHQQGIVHRDLKPENVFLANLDTWHVQPKIVDFGIARFAVPSVAPKLTNAGMLLGTPEFMSPEQVECFDDIDGRADLWAFGVTFYYLLAGRSPFTGDSTASLFESIMEAHVPFPIEARGLDGELWQIVTDCLRRERAQRWQRAEDVESALTRWLLSKGATEDMSGRSLRSSTPADRTRPTAPDLERSRAPSKKQAPSAPSSPSRPSLDQAIFSTLKKKLT